MPLFSRGKSTRKSHRYAERDRPDSPPIPVEAERHYYEERDERRYDEERDERRRRRRERRQQEELRQHQLQARQQLYEQQQYEQQQLFDKYQQDHPGEFPKYKASARHGNQVSSLHEHHQLDQHEQHSQPTTANASEHVSTPESPVECPPPRRPAGAAEWFNLDLDVADIVHDDKFLSPLHLFREALDTVDRAFHNVSYTICGTSALRMYGYVLGGDDEDTATISVMVPESCEASLRYWTVATGTMDRSEIRLAERGGGGHTAIGSSGSQRILHMITYRGRTVKVLVRVLPDHLFNQLHRVRMPFSRPTGRRLPSKPCVLGFSTMLNQLIISWLSTLDFDSRGTAIERSEDDQRAAEGDRDTIAADIFWALDQVHAKGIPLIKEDLPFLFHSPFFWQQFCGENEMAPSRFTMAGVSASWSRTTPGVGPSASTLDFFSQKVTNLGQIRRKPSPPAMEYVPEFAEDLDKFDPANGHVEYISNGNGRPLKMVGVPSLSKLRGFGMMPKARKRSEAPSDYETILCHSSDEEDEPDLDEAKAKNDEHRVNQLQTEAPINPEIAFTDPFAADKRKTMAVEAAQAAFQQQPKVSSDDSSSIYSQDDESDHAEQTSSQASTAPTSTAPTDPEQHVSPLKVNKRQRPQTYYGGAPSTFAAYDDSARGIQQLRQSLINHETAASKPKRPLGIFDQPETNASSSAQSHTRLKSSYGTGRDSGGWPSRAERDRVVQELFEEREALRQAKLKLDEAEQREQRRREDKERRRALRAAERGRLCCEEEEAEALRARAAKEAAAVTEPSAEERERIYLKEKERRRAARTAEKERIRHQEEEERSIRQAEERARRYEERAEHGRLRSREDEEQQQARATEKEARHHRSRRMEVERARRYEQPQRNLTRAEYHELERRRHLSELHRSESRLRERRNETRDKCVREWRQPTTDDPRRRESRRDNESDEKHRERRRSRREADYDGQRRERREHRQDERFNDEWRDKRATYMAPSSSGSAVHSKTRPVSVVDMFKVSSRLISNSL